MSRFLNVTFPKKFNDQFWGLAVFLRGRETCSIGRIKNTQITDENDVFFAKVRLSNNKLFFYNTLPLETYAASFFCFGMVN